jgi:hypothetical protein
MSVSCRAAWAALSTSPLVTMQTTQRSSVPSTWPDVHPGTSAHIFWPLHALCLPSYGPRLAAPRFRATSGRHRSARCCCCECPWKCVSWQRRRKRTHAARSRDAEALLLWVWWSLACCVAGGRCRMVKLTRVARGYYTVLLGFEGALLHRHTPNSRDLKTGRKPRTVATF